MNGVLRSVGRLSTRLLPRAAYPVVRGPLRGARFVLGAMSGEGGGASVYFNMVEPEQTAVFSTALKPGQVFFDIGANVGYYTVLGSRLVGLTGRVIAFEPVLRNLAYLYRHILLNGAGNVTVVPAACADAMSIALFAAGEDFATGRLRDEKSGSTFPVPVVSVDDVIRHVGISPDVMKIDVEGAELSVLKGAQGALRTSRPAIFLSTHSDALRGSCLEYLRGYGYTCDVLSHDKVNPSEFLARPAP